MNKRIRLLFIFIFILLGSVLLNSSVSAVVRCGYEVITCGSHTCEKCKTGRWSSVFGGYIYDYPYWYQCDGQRVTQYGDSYGGAVGFDKVVDFQCAGPHRVTWKYEEVRITGFPTGWHAYYYICLGVAEPTSITQITEKALDRAGSYDEEAIRNFNVIGNTAYWDFCVYNYGWSCYPRSRTINSCVCTSHDYSACWDNDRWWYDSCNIKEDKREECNTHLGNCDGSVWGDWYCQNNTTRARNRTCYDRGCSGDNCYANSYTDTETDPCPGGQVCVDPNGDAFCETPYIDIGLRIYNGTETVAIAAEPEGTLTSSLRVAKNGAIYGIVLVGPGDPNDSGARIWTSSGIKALRKLFSY